MRIRNLCPHSINILNASGVEVATLASEGCARVRSTPGAEVETVEGIPIHGPDAWGAVEGLPAPVEGVALLVSMIVGVRSPGRSDLLVPGTGPQDGALRVKEGPRKGQLLGVTRLKWAHPK